jgi:hypothetical protein
MVFLECKNIFKVILWAAAVALWKNVWKIIKNQNSFPADVL